MFGCLLRSLAANRHKPLRVKEALWVKVAELCGLGCTSAHRLCRDFGLDPHTGKPIKQEEACHDERCDCEGFCTKDHEHPHGFCPECGAPCIARERRPNGNDTCERGHKYPSRTVIMDSSIAAGIEEVYIL